MRTLLADDEVPRPEWRRGTTSNLTAAVITSLAGHGITVTPWQETLIDWALWQRARASGPIVATAGPAFPAGAAVPNVIIGEYVD